MTQTLYEQNLALLRTRCPNLTLELPEIWPNDIGASVLYGPDIPDRAADEFLQYYNPAIFILGWGSTGLVPAIIAHPRSYHKILVILVLPGEERYFSHFIGTEQFSSLEKHKALFLTFLTPDTEKAPPSWLPISAPSSAPSSASSKALEALLLFQTSRAVQDIYRSFDMITTLSGTRFLFDHPLCQEAEIKRKLVLPVIQNTLCNRIQSLGNDIQDNWVGIRNVILNCFGINRWPRSEELLDAAPHNTAICLASGPSANKWLPVLKQLYWLQKGKLDPIRIPGPILICTDSMLGGCLKVGIVPDYCCLVERFAEMIELFRFNIPESVTLICLPFTDPAVVAKFKKVIWWWGTDTAFDWADPSPKKMFCGRSSGTMTAAVAGVLDCDTAYLIGHDLAYGEATTGPDGAKQAGPSHSDATPELTRSEQDRVDLMASATAYQYGRQRLQVPKNGGGTIETSGIWTAFREDMEILIQVAPKTKYVNTNALAGPDGTTPWEGSGPSLASTGAVIAGTFPYMAGELDQPFGPTPDLALKSPLASTVAARDDAFRSRLDQLTKDWDRLITFYTEAYQTVKDAKPSNVTDEAIDILSAKIAEYLNTGSRPSLADQSGPSGPGPSQGLTSNAIVFDVLLRSLTNNLLLKYYGTTLPQVGGSPGATTQKEKNWLLFQALREIIFVMAETLKKFRPEFDKIAKGLP